MGFHEPRPLGKRAGGVCGCTVPSVEGGGATPGVVVPVGGTVHVLPALGAGEPSSEGGVVALPPGAYGSKEEPAGGVVACGVVGGAAGIVGGAAGGATVEGEVVAGGWEGSWARELSLDWGNRTRTWASAHQCEPHTMAIVAHRILVFTSRSAREMTKRIGLACAAERVVPTRAR